jgi:hypothetical protein
VVEAPDRPLGDLSGTLRFDPVQSGDGRLPAANTSLIDESDGTPMEHSTDFGWSRDGSRFGWCVPDGGASCSTCTLVGVDGKAQTWVRGPECPRRSQAEQIDAAWREHGIGGAPIPTTWKFGRDLTIVWKEVDGKEAEDGAVKRRARVRVGAKVADEKPAYFLDYDEPEMHEWAAGCYIFPEVVLPSPDGLHLAVLTHAFAGEFSDTFRVHFEKTDDFAFAAYEKTGLAVLRRRPARAAELFALAAALAPDAWKAHYNLACAQALAGRPDAAEAPLRRAIELGGSKVTEKIRTDADLTSVRERPWLEALLTR